MTPISSDPMRVLAITNLFPNVTLPGSAAFNRRQFSALAEICDLEVLGTIPYFPWAPTFAPKSVAAQYTRLSTTQRNNSTWLFL